MGRNVRLDETVAVGDGDRLGAAVHAELGQDVLDVRRHGLRAEEELDGDAPLVEPVRQQPEDVALA